MPVSQATLFKGSLIAVTFMIFVMVILGGLTRLTGSGLSIVEWKPITGILPPFTLKQWLIEFRNYQQTPEFQKVNMGMTLSEFQSIYWLEYSHRLWGRLLGVVLAIPTFLMIFKKRYRHLWPGVSFLWFLGFSQGLMGWIMVKSGLIQNPHISPYRLAAHLLLGFAILGTALWTTFVLYKDKFRFEKKGYSQKALQSLRKLSLIALALFCLTAFWGALVAGLKAGLVYNSFPLMGKSLIPHEFLTYSPEWRDLLENPVSVQFIHRSLAFITTAFCWGIFFYQRHHRFLIPKKLSYLFTVIAGIVLFQFSLGIITLLRSVPLSYAIFHQGTACVLFGSLLQALFILDRIQEHK